MKYVSYAIDKGAKGKYSQELIDAMARQCMEAQARRDGFTGELPEINRDDTESEFRYWAELPA